MSTSPPLIRPIPRRPFNIRLTSASPPDSSSPSPVHSDGKLDPKPHAGNSNGNGSTTPLNSGSDTPSFSRTRSILNLTSSTLFGIYAPTAFADDVTAPPTPFGTGAMTPRGSEANLALQLDMSPSSPVSRRPIRAGGSDMVQQIERAPSVLELGGRMVLLFVFGAAYGLLLTHFHSEERRGALGLLDNGHAKGKASWGFSVPEALELWYLVAWGMGGVAAGSLMPWVDRFFGDEEGDELAGNAEASKGAKGGSKVQEHVDWTPVVRSVGAFVGIAFAIRKLPWSSTLQLSLTLALVNPFLWYLLDRTRPSLLLSLITGLFGTAVLMLFDPGMITSPLSNVPWTDGRGNSTLGGLGGVGGGEGGIGEVGGKEGIAEGAVWIMSVLFCACLCFGNVGRRLALLRGREGSAK